MLWLFPETAHLFRNTLGAHGTIAFASVIAALMTFGGASIPYVLVEKPSMRVRSHLLVRQLWEPSREKSSLNEASRTSLERTGAGET